MKEIQEFHDENLLNKIYRYTVRPHKKNETFEIDIRFFKENLPHLLAIQKVVPKYKKRDFQGKRGYEGILSGNITINNLENYDSQRKARDKILPSIESRMTHFFLMEILMSECKMIQFSPEKVNGFCSISSEFILYHEELGVKLHLGVLKEQSNKNLYIPETFIVKSIRARDKDRLTNSPPQLYMNIECREIINLSSLEESNPGTEELIAITKDEK